MKKKNIFLFSVLVLVLLLAGACASPAPAGGGGAAPVAQETPPPEPAPAPQPQPVPPSPSSPADSYNRHSSGIILNGAAQYTVQAGNTLAGIGWRLYNDGSLYPLILMVNDGIISDPDKIEPNMRLTVPALRENMNDARARESLNRKLREVAVIEEQRGRSETAALMRNHAR